MSSEQQKSSLKTWSGSLPTLQQEQVFWHDLHQQAKTSEARAATVRALEALMLEKWALTHFLPQRDESREEECEKEISEQIVMKLVTSVRLWCHVLRDISHSHFAQNGPFPLEELRRRVTTYRCTLVELLLQLCQQAMGRELLNSDGTAVEGFEEKW